MRIGPLLDASGLTADDLATAADELAERCWVTITSGLGRWRYPVTWPY